MRVIQERDGSNIIKVSYTRGPDLSRSFEGAGGIGGLMARTAHSGASGLTYAHAFYHTDRGGNVTYLLNSGNTMGAIYKYDPFGRTLDSSGSLATANVYRFSSKEWHATTGLYYYGYRFYDPLTQRWLNRDPIQESGGMNLYSFVGNKPISNVDAFGLEEDMPGYLECFRDAEREFVNGLKLPICVANWLLDAFPDSRRLLRSLPQRICPGRGLVKVACMAVIGYAVWPVFRIADKVALGVFVGAAGYTAGCGVSFMMRNDVCRSVHLGHDTTPMFN